MIPFSIMQVECWLKCQKRGRDWITGQRVCVAGGKVKVYSPCISVHTHAPFGRLGLCCESKPPPFSVVCRAGCPVLESGISCIPSLQSIPRHLPHGWLILKLNHGPWASENSEMCYQTKSCICFFFFLFPFSFSGFLLPSLLPSHCDI